MSNYTQCHVLVYNIVLEYSNNGHINRTIMSNSRMQPVKCSTEVHQIQL